MALSIPWDKIKELTDQCTTVKDLCYCLAKYHCLQQSIRWNNGDLFEVFQLNGTWMPIMAHRLTEIMFNKEFNNALLHLNSNIQQQLSGFDKVQLVKLVNEAFLYHLYPAITGPFVYFVSVYNDGFEPIIHFIGWSKNIEVDTIVYTLCQSEGTICQLHAIVQSEQSENLCAELCRVLTKRRTDFLSNKFQITRQDISFICQQLRLWPYLKN